MMFNDPDLAGVKAFSGMVEQVYWAIFPKNELLLRAALYQTAQIYGGIDQFASICDVPFDEFYKSIKADRLDIKFFHKVFPYIVPQLKVLFTQYMEDETKKELRELFSKNGLDSGEDLVHVVNKTIMEFELSDQRKKQEEIARNLTILSNYFLDQYEAEKRTKEK